jgi:chromosomal replication initiator protein
VTLDKSDLTDRLENWWNVPRKYVDCRFSTFDPYTRELRSRLEIAKRVAAERTSALLFGPPGSGKSHLATSIMAHWIARGARGRFISALGYSLQVQAAFGNPRSIADDLLDDASFALLDDLGTQRDNETGRIAILYLIDRAYAARQRLIVTSNLTPAQLNQFDPRVMSRFAEMGVIIEMKAEDYRLRIAARRQKADAEKPLPAVN